MLGVERAPIEVVDDGLRHSVRIGDAVDFEIEDIVPFGVETGEPVRFDGMFHPVGSDLDDGRGEALADRRVRHRVRGQDGALDVRVLLGRLSAVIAVRARARPRGAGLVPAFAAARARLGLVALLFASPPSPGGGRSTRARHGRGPWTALGTLGGSSACGS